MTNSIQVQDNEIQAILREELQRVIWDVAKDATGVRPRWIDFENSTIEELEDTLKLYSKMAEEEADREHQMEKEAIAEYEARVEQLIECGAGDRETAVRWMIEAESERYLQDVEELMYHWGMPYTFTPRLPEHIKAEVKEAFAQAALPDIFEEA